MSLRIWLRLAAGFGSCLLIGWLAGRTPAPGVTGGEPTTEATKEAPPVFHPPGKEPTPGVEGEERSPFPPDAKFISFKLAGKPRRSSSGWTWILSDSVPVRNLRTFAYESPKGTQTFLVPFKVWEELSPKPGEGAELEAWGLPLPAEPGRRSVGPTYKVLALRRKD